MITTRALAPALLCAAAFALPASAKEGPDQYPNGAENWFAGAVPPPGSYFINYAGHYSGEMRDGSGNKVPGVKVAATFDAMRYVQVTKQKLLGADWAWHVIVPVVRQKLDIAPLGGEATKTGLGDITLNPIILAWHTPTWHYAAGLDINLPTGAYDKDDPRRSIGANYASVEPVLAASYLGQRWEVSGKLMLNLKQRNKDTDYKSGTEVHADYLVGRNFGPWGVGLSGYYLKQVTDDKRAGVKVGPDGNRGQVLALGPSLKYTGEGGLTWVAQWQHETEVRNRFQGDKLWVKLILPIQ